MLSTNLISSAHADSTPSHPSSSTKKGSFSHWASLPGIPAALFYPIFSVAVSMGITFRLLMGLALLIPGIFILHVLVKLWSKH